MVKTLLACILFAASFSSCQRKAMQPSPGSESGSAASANSAANSESNSAATAPAVPPFTLSLSSGGGFTGSYSGFTLSSDGSVRQWERRGAGSDSILWETRIPAARIIGFKNRLEQSGALGIGLRETGNMTTQVKLVLPDTLHVWSWSGADAAETAPEPFRSWYPEVRDFCAALQSTNPKAQSRPDGK